MKARIFRPTKTAMQQAGQGNGNHWVLEFVPQSAPYIDPLMGWTGQTDTTQQLRLTFTTQKEAIEYASKNGITFELKDPKARTVKPKSYSANFAFDRIQDTGGTNQ